MNKSFALVLTLLAAATLPACGSSSDSKSGGSSCASADGAFGDTSAACQACVKSSCSSQYSALCSAGCDSAPSGSTCQKAAGDVASCIVSSCDSECNDQSSGGTSSGGTSSGGTSNTAGSTSSTAGTSSGGSSAGGTGGAPTATNCIALEACCQMLSSGVKDGCEHIVGLDDDTSCAGIHKTYVDANQCPGANGNTGNSVSCYYKDMGFCLKSTTAPAYVDMVKMACINAGNTAPDTCPTAGLVGCCKIGSGASASENCFYTEANISAADGATACTQTTGTWSTTP